MEGLAARQLILLVFCFLIVGAWAGFNWGYNLRESEIANYMIDNEYTFCYNGTAQPIRSPFFNITVPEEIKINLPSHTD